MFNEVDDLPELATAVGMPFSYPQILSIRIRLMKNMQEFDKGLNKWYDLPEIDRTWLPFKTHFANAQEHLCRVRGPTMQSGALNN